VRAVEALGRKFGQLMEEAKVRLGGLFRSEDYPAPDELCSKFSFEAKVMPLPDAGDLQVIITSLCRKRTSTSSTKHAFRRTGFPLSRE
jgi:hypothetical protein